MLAALQTDCRQTADRLQAQFGVYAYQFRTIRFWIAEARLGRKDLYDEICTGRPPLDDLDSKILAILDKSSFKSAYSIAERLLVARLIMLRYLHDPIGFKSFHLYWVSYLLIHDLCEKRKEYAKMIVPFLHAAERDDWHHLVTGDELWFFLNTSPRRMWTLSRDDVVTKPRLDIQSKKFIFTIIWNPSGFYVIDRLPNDIKNE
jgi:hypothetical protein